MGNKKITVSSYKYLMLWARSSVGHNRAKALKTSRPPPIHGAHDCRRKQPQQTQHNAVLCHIITATHHRAPRRPSNASLKSGSASLRRPWASRSTAKLFTECNVSGC